MASIRPTLKEIHNRIHNDAQVLLDEEHLRRSDLAVFEAVIAGASHALYNAINYGRKQLFIDSCDTQYLERIAGIFGIVRKSAAKAAGKIQFKYAVSAVDAPIGTVVQTSSGYQYETTASPTAEGIVPVRAVLAGEQYNIDKDTELTLPSPIAGVTGAVVVEEILGGTDLETDDELRARVLARTQNPPRQGTKSDFIAWAKEVEGVSDAWCYPKEQGDGTVVIRILGPNKELPDETLLEKVKAYLISKASVLATIYVLAPIAQTFDFTLKITPDTLTNRNLAEQAIRKVFNDESIPGGKIYLSHISKALSDIASEDDHTILSPTTDIEAQDSSYLPTVGSISWQD